MVRWRGKGKKVEEKMVVGKKMRTEEERVIGDRGNGGEGEKGNKKN